MGPILNRTLFHGDNLSFLRGMNSDTIDLIATDPAYVWVGLEAQYRLALARREAAQRRYSRPRSASRAQRSARRQA